MEKQMKITVDSVQTDDMGEKNEIRTVAEGKYILRESGIYLLYEECHEGFPGSTKTMLHLRENSLELTRKGSVNTRMLFRAGKSCRTEYRTSVGMLQAEIDTSLLRWRKGETELTIEVRYVLKMNGQHISENYLVICAQYI